MSLPAVPLFADVAQGLSGGRAAPFGLCLRLEELTLRVRSNSAMVIDDLRGYFEGFVCQDVPADVEFLFLDGPVATPPVELAPRACLPGKRPDKERCADLHGGRMVRKQATGMLFLFGQGMNMASNIAIGPCAQNRNQLVNFLCARYMERRVAAGWILGHASGVVLPGAGGPLTATALALCGFSGMGKSTLALHLVARGLDFLSNDRVLVESRERGGPVLHGIPKHPRLNPGTALGNPELAPLLTCALPEGLRRACEGLAPAALRQVEDKYDARIDACFGPSRFTLAAPLGGLVVLNWRHGGGPLEVRRVELHARRDLLDALRKEPGAFYLPEALAASATGGARLSAGECLEALSGVPALELCGGSDFAAGATACLEFLGEAARMAID